MLIEADIQRLLQRVSVLEFAIERGRSDVKERKDDRQIDAVFSCIESKWHEVKMESFRILGIDELAVATGGEYLGEPNK